MYNMDKHKNHIEHKKNRTEETGSDYDIVLISGEPYVDHPFSGIGIIKKVLEDKGFSVAVIETPDWAKDDDFLQYGKPKLFFGVSSGAIDSMLVNYTPMKKKREETTFCNRNYSVPDRAVMVYCNMIKKLFKGSKIVIAGTEASTRRFAHFDYWQNRVRRSILLEARADILVYGHGEKQIIEIAEKLKKENIENSIDSIKGINGTCIAVSEKDKESIFPEGTLILPSFDEVEGSKEKFCDMQNMFNPNKNLAQKFDTRYVLQYKKMEYSTEDLDYIYSLDFSREIPEDFKEFGVVKNSILTHRGCFGGCNFCTIHANNGKDVISRSKESIVREAKKIIKKKDFNGIIELSAASANMYGMDCVKSGKCGKHCIKCSELNRSHDRIIDLLKTIREMKGVKKVMVKSGIRYDLALSSKEYIKELVKHHIGERFMIAPEHISKQVLKDMNKEEDSLEEFLDIFRRIRREEKMPTELSFYLMVGHPGCTIENSKELREFTKKYPNTNFVQVFTPTPMSVSTAMYYTGLDPKTKKKIYVPYTYNEKKKQKNIVMGEESNRRSGKYEYDDEEEDDWEGHSGNYRKRQSGYDSSPKKGYNNYDDFKKGNVKKNNDYRASNNKNNRRY
jgi:uncharacterized radical SAM protein YgiQ